MSISPPVFRFAPSPNGGLHLGHAYSALINQDMAKDAGGRMLLRIEDIDQTRCSPELEEQMLEDLRWIGFEWDDNPRRQSEHFAAYADALETLRDAGLIYPAFMTRGEIKRAVQDKATRLGKWPCDPDGSPHYPGDERDWPVDKQNEEIDRREKHMWRLNMALALDHIGGDLFWQETGAGPCRETGEQRADPAAWGDVVLARSDTPTSYHLAVTVDDGLQGVSHVVRGRDLFHATSVHRLLQCLIGLPAPIYHHHDLILADDKRKLSKSAEDTSLRALREAGLDPIDVRRMVGL